MLASSSYRSRLTCSFRIWELRKQFKSYCFTSWEGASVPATFAILKVKFLSLPLSHCDNTSVIKKVNLRTSSGVKAARIAADCWHAVRLVSVNNDSLDFFR